MIPCMIVPILKGPETLYRMLETIDYPIRKLIIIDNGDALRHSLGWPVEHVQSTKVIKMPANLGVAGSWNLGIKADPFAPWWLIANYDVEWPSGSLKAFSEQAGEGILLAHSPQPWSAFALSEDAVKRVGLFDEGFHPAYFEDNDYELRRRQSSRGDGLGARLRCVIARRLADDVRGADCRGNELRRHDSGTGTLLQRRASSFGR